MEFCLTINTRSFPESNHSLGVRDTAKALTKVLWRVEKKQHPIKEKRCGKEKKAEKHRWDCLFHNFAHGSSQQPWEHMLQPSHYREWNWSKALVAVLWNSSVPLPQGCIPHRQLSATEQVQHTQVDRFLLPRRHETPLLSRLGSRPRQTFLRLHSSLRRFLPIFSLSLSLSIRLASWTESPRLIRLPFYFLSQASPLIKVLHIKFHCSLPEDSSQVT